MTKNYETEPKINKKDYYLASSSLAKLGVLIG